MTRDRSDDTVELPRVPAVVVKHFRSDSRPTAVCAHCGWSQIEASLGEMRMHVRHHPSHVVTRTDAAIIRVWAEDRNGMAWEGGIDV